MAAALLSTALSTKHERFIGGTNLSLYEEQAQRQSRRQDSEPGLE